MSVQQTIQSSMYSDIDDLTAIIRRMHLQRGVCRSDGIALEAHIALPSSIRQYTEAPSRTQYDRTLAIAKAKRANLHHDLYAMESRAVLTRPDMPLTELCASMEAITGRHFLLFGGVLAMLAILFKFFGVDGGGGGGGGGGGASATAAVGAAETRAKKLDVTVDRVKTAIAGMSKPNATNPILTSYSSKQNGAQPVGDLPPNHAALVVAAESVAKHIRAMFGGIDPADFDIAIKSPDSMRDFLLGERGPSTVMGRRFYMGKLVGLDGSATWADFIQFGEALDDWLEKRMGAVSEFLKDVMGDKKHSSNEFKVMLDNLEVIAVFPESLMNSKHPSSYNDAIASAMQEIKNAESELRIAVTPHRIIAWINASASYIRAANGKLMELWFAPLPSNAHETVVKITQHEIIDGLAAPVGKLAEGIDKLANRQQQLSQMQQQLVITDKHLAEKHEMHKDHLTDQEMAEMAALRYVNATLVFTVGMLTRCTGYMHGKVSRINNISSYLGSFEVACISLEKLYVLL